MVIRYILFIIILCFHYSIQAKPALKSDDLISLEQEYISVSKDQENIDELIENIEDSLVTKQQKEEAPSEIEEQLEEMLENNYFTWARFLAINKITTKSEFIDIKIGTSKFFGNIEITPIKCWRSPDLIKKDNRILCKAQEHKENTDPSLVFHGWMFSNDRSLSTFEHPVYEIFAIKCSGTHDKEGL